MSRNYVYFNQPLSVDLTFYDQNDSVIDLSGGSVEVELFAPSNKTQTPTVTLSCNIQVATDGTANVFIPAGTFTEIRQWRIQPYATDPSGIRWPAKVDDIVVTQLGSMN